MSNSLFNIFKNIKMSNVISSTNNTLNVVKKIIPVYKEVRPFFNHEKTIFNNNATLKEIKNIEEEKKDISINDNLTFFQ